MSRSIADTPTAAPEPVSREKQGASRLALPLEVQLWIEIALLIAIGLIMIYSASSVLPFKNFSEKTEIARSSLHYLNRQMICIALGLAVMVVARRVPYQWFTYHASWMLLVVFAAPAYGPDPRRRGGIERRPGDGSNSRVSLLQPAEYAKVVWVLYLGVLPS